MASKHISSPHHLPPFPIISVNLAKQSSAFSKEKSNPLQWLPPRSRPTLLPTVRSIHLSTHPPTFHRLSLPQPMDLLTRSSLYRRLWFLRCHVNSLHARPLKSLCLPRIIVPGRSTSTVLGRGDDENFIFVILHYATETKNRLPAIFYIYISKTKKAKKVGRHDRRITLFAFTVDRPIHSLSAGWK